MAALPAILVRCLLLCSQTWIKKSETSSCLLFRVVNLDMLVSENVLILKSPYSTCWGSKGRFTRGLRVSSHLRSICAISAVESVEVQTNHFTWVPSPKYDMDVYMVTLLWGEAWDLLRVGSSKNLDSPLNTSPVNIFTWNNQDSTLMILIIHILLVSWVSEVGTLPPCSDLLTWVELGIPCELALIKKMSKVQWV